MFLPLIFSKRALKGIILKGNHFLKGIIPFLSV